MGYIEIEQSDGLMLESRIGYIRKDIPSFEVSPYKGKRYKAMVPDTLDIAERAELAINGLTGPTDPEADYEIYFVADFFNNPPLMIHKWSDLGGGQAKFMEALPLLRIIVGSNLNSHVDRVWMEGLLKSIGNDGLFYMPTDGRPWGRGPSDWLVWREDGTTTKLADESVTQFTWLYYCSRIINAMIIYYLHDKNPVWKEAIERAIHRLSQIAIDKGDYCYFPRDYFEPNAKVSPDAELLTGFWSVPTGGGGLIQGLAQYYKGTGYEPAKKLAAKIVKYLRYHSKYYDAEGRFLVDPEGPTKGIIEMGRIEERLVKGLVFGEHFHHHTIGVLGMLEYALVINDRELMEYVKKSYVWAKAQGSDLVGFFPELIVPYYLTCETCEVADMIAIALKLTEAGLGDYWDDVDRWVRNQFIENQLVKADWVYRIPRSERGSVRRHPPQFNETDDRVAQRNLGGFSAWSSGNEYTIRTGVLGCCTGNAARTIYYIWEHILDYDDRQLQVNLLLNRASKWADVNSYIPYEGRVDLKIKQPCKIVLVRVPEWIEGESKEVACTVNSESRELKWEGRYVNTGEAKPGDKVTVTFPIWERTVREMIGGVLYTLTIKGNTVVYIDPPGKHCPIYQRAHYRENRTRWHKITRFVSEEHIHW